jgi:hypothetical protein
MRSLLGTEVPLAEKPVHTRLPVKFLTGQMIDALARVEGDVAFDIAPDSAREEFERGSNHREDCEGDEDAISC